MTREEALDILTHNWTRVENPNYDESELDEAYYMAIEALKTEDHDGCKDCRYEPNDEYEMPCKECKQNYMDQWQPKQTGEWIQETDTGIKMLKCSVCECRVQEKPYRLAVGEAATKCPYCGAELGQGGYSYDEYAEEDK